eukprot:12410079-Karenia_brevis.AAC.1
MLVGISNRTAIISTLKHLVGILAKSLEHNCLRAKPNISRDIGTGANRRAMGIIKKNRINTLGVLTVCMLTGQE